MTKNIKLFPYLRRFDEENSMRYWCTQWLVYCIQEIVGKQGLGERENLCENTETPQIFINEKTYAQHIVFSINLYARLLWYWCVPLGNIHGVSHADVIKWKHFPRYWPFVRGSHRWIPLTKASDTELLCFLWSVPEQIAEQTIETPVI